MATVTELEARRERLERAIDSGALMVKHGEKTVTYRSQREMERALARLESKIAEANGSKKPIRQRRIYTRRAV